MLKSSKSFVIVLIFLLLLSSCHKKTDDHILVEKSLGEPKGEFIIEGESYELRVFKTLPYNSEIERFLFFSKPYPIEGEDVDSLHIIGIDIIKAHNILPGTYSFTGNSSINSIIQAYSGTNLTFRNNEHITGIFREYNKGEILISQDGNDYYIEIELKNDTVGFLVGNYSAKIP